MPVPNTGFACECAQTTRFGFEIKADMCVSFFFFSSFFDMHPLLSVSSNRSKVVFQVAFVVLVVACIGVVTFSDTFEVNVKEVQVPESFCVS